jgi:hypothetical protein
MNVIYDNECPLGLGHVLIEVQHLVCYVTFRYICKQTIDFHEILCKCHDAGGPSTLVLSAYLCIIAC